MKSEIELKAIAFDKYMEACEHKDATIDMKIAGLTLSAVLAAETYAAKKRM